MDAKPLTVRRFDLGRYMVRSERPACEDWYLVSFDEPGFPKGFCDCTDFSVRVAAPVHKGEQPERWTCKHVTAVHAELEHARMLCEMAGLEFSPNIIPIHGL